MSTGAYWHEARLRAFESGAGALCDVESVSLSDAVGRVLVDPVIALRPLPGFDTAAMDGYAVVGDQPWTVAGRTLAGEAPPAPLRAGEAWEVATGAATPPNASSVVPYERASVVDGAVCADAHGVNIRRAGEEAALGEVLLSAGVRVTPAMVALAAAAGLDSLQVRRRPLLAAIITGDEVMASGVPAAGQVRDAIGPSLAGWVSWAGGSLVGVARVADDAVLLAEAVANVAADVVLVSGSSSVGAADHLEKTLLDIGALPVVRSVECVPGRTQSLWALPDGRLLIGLPGNPFAAFVAFLTLAVPACAGLSGGSLPELTSVATCDSSPHAARTRLVPVQVEGDHAVACDFSRSAMLRGLVSASALAVVPPSGSSGRVELVMLPR